MYSSLTYDHLSLMHALNAFSFLLLFPCTSIHLISTMKIFTVLPFGWLMLLRHLQYSLYPSMLSSGCSLSHNALTYSKQMDCTFQKVLNFSPVLAYAASTAVVTSWPILSREAVWLNATVCWWSRVGLHWRKPESLYKSLRHKSLLLLLPAWR